MNREKVVVLLDEKKFMHRDDRLIILLRHVLRTPTYSLKDIIGNRLPNASNFFQYPCDVVIDERRSLLFVSDCGELNIQVFDLHSRELMYNIKTVDRPRFMAMYCDSLIFSSEDGFVYRFDLETRSEIWKSSGKMSNPCGVIVDEMRGLVFVCECGGNTIQTLSAETGKVRSILVLTPKRPTLFYNNDNIPSVSNPYGIAFSLDRNYFVVSSVVNAKIYLVDKKGKIVHSFGEHGSKPNQFNFPSSLEVSLNHLETKLLYTAKKHFTSQEDCLSIMQLVIFT
ncbi:predicted protein [Naegleria gruberi]|uniref:Predicted protein n=1 Tax=Naegleria gruberi TaxID=5762 RepID=D2V856_NAEGR|nr:uncharacterized protein NAEGRDRAFT_65035 [Naegleria gruberi]EFC46986.1 predicted protein [Naegleria gruberi]|eukprot:XP_002679730.1 predicted protein [Naegleria gruberi strain NEG-M]